MDIAAGGTSAVAVDVLRDTEQLAAVQVDELFASLGLGTAISALV
ncbi:MAG TPA: hypothetical protein VMD91_17765 [Candidatus Sulfotelmatobacter sp.]|nr:hypothetical protein [Candidatus Sulfotelmatobacter sp.]